MGILRRLFGRKYVPSSELPYAANEGDDHSLPTRPSFHTSTATVVIYDLESLKHRLDDEVDWWADPQAELDEINARNLLIVGLGFDGFYDLDIIEEERDAASYSLRFPSGKVFIGPGEALTGGGDEPDESCSGVFLNVTPGDYKVAVGRSDDQLRISVTRSVAFENAVFEPIRA